MTSCEIVIYERLCNILFALVLSHSKFLDALKTILKFAKTFALEYGLPFIEARIECITTEI